MIDWILAKLRKLPPWGIGLVAIGAVALVVGGAVAGYRTYDYVEHDNEFCLSCHLMVEPYELFAKSAHRDMGCKACHKPTFAARSQMALSQIVENPDSLTAHAEVPNEKCASCHIEGDPDRWESIRNSAGHRVHFESSDSSLQGLKCVECHSSSLHQFTAASETCAQSGCHTDSDIQLGGMGNLTIHCTACHGFSDPVPEDTPIREALNAVRPDAQACLSCHAMRTLVEMPEDEPHDAVCGSCHNPHEQTTPEQAVESCATSDCHAQPRELTPMHRGLTPGALADCTQCHEAHDWRLEAENCVSCHQAILRDDGRPTGASSGDVASAGRAAPSPSPAEPDVGLLRARRAGLVHAATGPGEPGSGPSVGGVTRAVATAEPAASRRIPPPPPAGAMAPQVTDTTFRHRTHRNVECTSCHSTEQSHGQLTVVGIRDCRSCHHTQPVAQDCSRCHVPGATPGATYELSVTMNFSVGTVRGREITFQHAPHDELDCSRCHTEGLALTAYGLDCGSCHENHHRPDVSCMTCHVQAPESAHPNEVHQGCTGSGCHTEIAEAIRNVPRTRPFCLSCHQDLVDHRPGQNCEECHRLPGVLGGGDG